MLWHLRRKLRRWYRLHPRSESVGARAEKEEKRANKAKT